MVHRGLPRATHRAHHARLWQGSACWLVALVLALCSLTSGAFAQTPEVEAEAKQLFQRGVEASDAGRWAEAADFFQRSRELLERPNTLFNLVGVLHRLGRYREGLEVGAAYLRAPSTAAEQDKRTEVERLLADMELAVGVVRVSVVPRTAKVALDGRALAMARDRYELTLDPGRHQLTAEAPGHERQELTFVVERGGRLMFDITLLPVSATSAPPLSVLPADEARRAPHGTVDPVPLTKRQKRVRRALWATGGILVAGGIAAFMIAGAATDEEDPEPTGGTTGITLPL